MGDLGFYDVLRRLVVGPAFTEEEREQALASIDAREQEEAPSDDAVETPPVKLESVTASTGTAPDPSESSPPAGNG